MCGDYNLRREKRYVGVDVRFTPDGKIRPLAINYDRLALMELIVSWQSSTVHHVWRERALLHLPDLRAEAKSLA